jgi:hypothetical protein
MATRKPAAPKTTRAPRKSPAKPAAQRKTASKTTATKAPAAKPAKQPAVASQALSIFSFGALAVAAGAGIFELVRRFALPRSEGTVPTDLMGNEHPGPEDRAIDDFRPDPTAAVPASEREAMQPALVRPALVAV